MNRTYANWIKTSEMHLCSQLKTRFKTPCILNFDSFIEKEYEELGKYDGAFVTEPSLRELEDLHSKFPEQQVVTSSSEFVDYLRKNGLDWISHFQVTPAALKLTRNEKLCIGFRGADHPLGGLEVFVGTIKKLEMLLGKNVDVHIDLTRSTEDSLPAIPRYADYYSLSGNVVKWKKRRDQLLSGLSVCDKLPDIIFSPGFAYNCGYDHFLASFGASGGKILFTKVPPRSDLPGSRVSPYLFQNYVLGKPESLMNQYVYEKLAELLEKLC